MVYFTIYWEWIQLNYDRSLLDRLNDLFNNYLTSLITCLRKQNIALLSQKSKTPQSLARSLISRDQMVGILPTI